MKVTFFINYLNHHQLPVADELYRILGDDFRFVATFPRNIAELKGGEDGSTRPYCLLPAEHSDDRKLALELVVQSDVCLFGAGNLDWERLRARTDKLSFEISERWFKRGWINLLSPRLWQWWWLYQTRLRNKPFYKLCASAFTASDCRKLWSFRNRCYKWGYFPSVPLWQLSRQHHKVLKIIWCARLIPLKHPEVVINVGRRLKSEGYEFEIELCGDGPLRQKLTAMIVDEKMEDIVFLRGNMPHEKVLETMGDSDILLFTSDKKEGWGAVVNEAMSNACCVIASNHIGSVPYLIQDGRNGLIYDGNHPEESLYRKLKYTLDNPDECRRMAMQAQKDLTTLWSPETAAKNLLQLIDALKSGRPTPVSSGPCSEAY